MEIHLYSRDKDIPKDNIYNGYNDLIMAVVNKRQIINTTQVMFISTILLDLDYRIFVHCEDGVKEIKLGKNDGTDREIGKGHNLPKLILAGEFGKFSETLKWVIKC